MYFTKSPRVMMNVRELLVYMTMEEVNRNPRRRKVPKRPKRKERKVCPRITGRDGINSHTA